MGEFRQLLKDHGITSHKSAPGSLKQEGVAERRNKVLLDMVRSLMSYISLPDSFWEYALVIVQDIMSLVTSKVISTTPDEFWTGHKPRTGSDLGSPAYVLKRDPNY